MTISSSTLALLFDALSDAVIKTDGAEAGSTSTAQQAWPGGRYGMY